MLEEREHEPSCSYLDKGSCHFPTISTSGSAQRAALRVFVGQFNDALCSEQDVYTVFIGGTQGPLTVGSVIQYRAERVDVFLFDVQTG